MTKSSTNANNDLDRNPPTISEVRNTPIIGNLYNDDGDDNENGKKAIGLDWQNNDFARASRFFVHFFAVAERLRREMPNYTFCGKR